MLILSPNIWVSSEVCANVFFFFKQKTAYEIGTGDWSSDVCSSDLGSVQPLRHFADGAERVCGFAHAQYASRVALGLFIDRKSVV